MKQFNTYKLEHVRTMDLLSKRVSKKTQKEVDCVEAENDGDRCCFVFTLKEEKEDDGFIVYQTLIVTDTEANEFIQNYVTKKYQVKVVSCDYVDHTFVIKTESIEFEEKD